MMQQKEKLLTLADLFENFSNSHDMADFKLALLKETHPGNTVRSEDASGISMKTAVKSFFKLD